MRYYKPRHFVAQELIPPSVFSAYGERGLLAIDSRILWTLDALCDSPLLKKPLGVSHTPITVNTYHMGGEYSQRGLRDDPKLLAEAPLSQHRFGRAVDCDIYGISAEDFRQMARAGLLSRELQYVTRVEDCVDWIHCDCAGISGTEISFFKV